MSSGALNPPSAALASRTVATPAIEAKGLGKIYQRDVSLWRWIARGLGLKDHRAGAGVPDGVAALRDVSFHVTRGEAFGIIGRNGAGKSTLLQILAGTLAATTGERRVDGRVTALLELGSGFNPEFTGRENVYLAGSILGISRREMDVKFDDIARFADIGPFIDEPAKTYSTGMLMRVAFAVAISVEPDVLIIDEALSVGDILFQQKCSRRLRELIASGVTLLVVTHDLAFVLNLCQRALWLDQGKMRYLGAAGACVREYVAAMTALSGNVPAPADDYAGLSMTPLPGVGELAIAHSERLGQGGIKVERAWLLQADGAAASTFRLGDWVVAVVLVRAVEHVRGVSAGCELRNRHGQVVFATGLRVTRQLVDEIPAGRSCTVSIRFRMELQPGQYTLDLGCSAGFETDNSWERVLNTAVIEVSNPPDQEIVHGLVRLPYEIRVSRAPESSVR